MAERGELRERVNYTLSPEALELIEETAEALGIARSQVVEQAVRLFWTEHAARIARRLRSRRHGQR